MLVLSKMSGLNLWSSAATSRPQMSLAQEPTLENAHFDVELHFLLSVLWHFDGVARSNSFLKRINHAGSLEDFWLQMWRMRLQFESRGSQPKNRILVGAGDDLIKRLDSVLLPPYRQSTPSPHRQKILRRYAYGLGSTL
ncbi:hypothetical protein C8R45DRAFT_1215839 [Mycena sanguinolenta]|nr:hypothetical protein C8R45DRAFT_1215839 [Mycena sanguinolenta]